MTTLQTTSFHGQSLRPSEKVQHFFEEQLLAGRGISGGRLPTIKEIARHLDVGVSTVQSVFARLSSEGKIVTIPGKGTFLSEETRNGAALISTAVTVMIREHQLAGQESTWGKEICTAMLREATNRPEGEMTIRPFFPEGKPNLRQLLEQEAQKTAGAIIFPDPLGTALSEPFEAINKSVVHIMPSYPRATGNFIAPDFYGICEKISDVWCQVKRKHIAVILHMPLRKSASCTLSLAGLQAGLQDEGGAMRARLSYHSLDNEKPDVPKVMKALYASKPYPDAIYSPGDYIAMQAAEWLMERGFRVPEEVSIIGGTGLAPSHHDVLPCTVIQQPFERMGQEAIRMLVERLRSNNAPLPGRYVEVAIRTARTTTEQENRLLETGA